MSVAKEAPCVKVVASNTLLTQRSLINVKFCTSSHASRIPLFGTSDIGFGGFVVMLQAFALVQDVMLISVAFTGIEYTHIK
jgi:hypothetical protein